jgi:hypothetical protein
MTREIFPSIKILQITLPSTTVKKITIILLVHIYSLSTLGLSLKGFYCCGKLKTGQVFHHTGPATGNVPTMMA